MIKTTPYLSILIPTRNRAEYLYYAIKSALNVDSDSIEVIVSENHSNDNSLEICNSFIDARLKVIKPEKPLAMHENWELLLHHARGDWITFIGDDDAVMPHVVDHLLWIERSFPCVEAIAATRAYYFWDGTQPEYGQIAVSYSFEDKHSWIDSKKELERALEGEVEYIYLPQIYSGGFHRKSLVKRVLRSQNGEYFKSVTPDAYSSIMGCLHTLRFVRTNIPMTWVGSSPHVAISKNDKTSFKDRDADFWNMHSEESLVPNYSLGSYKGGPFLIHFYEAYISAIPLTSATVFSLKRFKELLIKGVYKLRKSGIRDSDNFLIKYAMDLDLDLVFFPQNDLIEKLKAPIEVVTTKILAKIKQLYYKTHRFSSYNQVYFSSSSHINYPHILSCDSEIELIYSKIKSSRK